MPLPHFAGPKKIVIGICKYCKSEVRAYRFEENPMDCHIDENKCKSKFREERLKKILDGNN